MHLDQRISWAIASPDNRTAAALTYDPNVPRNPNTGPHVGGFTLVDLVSGRVLHEGELGLSAEGAEFSPDGRRLAVGGRDGEVGLLDVPSGRPVHPPVRAHQGLVPHLAFAPDSRTFVTGSDDGLVGLWNAQTGTPLATVLPGPPDNPTSPHFLTDGHTVIVATLDGTLYTWDTRPERWVNYACTVAGRNLTPAESVNTFGERPYRETCPAS